MSKVQQVVRSYLYLVGFCFAIAGVLWSLDDDAAFFPLLLTSLFIGFSINGSFSLLQPQLEKFLPLWLAFLISAVGGLSLGLLLAGTMLIDRPFFFFEDGQLALPIFFGVVGFAIFGTRERLNETRAQLARAQNEKLATEKQHIETQLKLLQAQIEPHFLFNTLSNVAGMIEAKPKEAEATLINLTTLLRSALRRSRAENSTLADELEIVRAYLEIQHTRMGERLTFSVKSQPRLASVILPPLLLQPLVENAIKHGIDPLKEGGDIQVCISENGSSLEINVKDTGGGIDPSGATAGEGTGLKNIRARLRALYGDAASLSLKDNTPRGIMATLTLPISNSTATQNDNRATR